MNVVVVKVADAKFTNLPIDEFRTQSNVCSQLRNSSILKFDNSTIAQFTAASSAPPQAAAAPDDLHK
jgi:hypothetical protein